MNNTKINAYLAVIFFITWFCLPALLSAQIVKLKWINFSPYTEIGQNPDQGDSIPDAQIICLLDTLQPWVEGIRTFGTQKGLQNIPILAKQRGFKVIVGIWLGKENTPAGLLANTQQIANGIAIANAGYADRLIVGSEVLFRNDLPDSVLLNYIEEVKLACPNIPVSTADICGELISHPNVVDACDFVAPNIYPFWEGSPIECAMQRFHQCYSSLLPVANGKEIFISESGWKTAGNPVGAAVSSFENAIRYNRELLGWSQALEVDVNLFSAFDEPWKLPNDDGWGLFFNDKTMKPGMDTLFAPIDNISSTWLCETLNNFTNDTLFIDYIPVIGSFSLVKGHIDHLNPCDYRIATYIKVGGGWWTKQTFLNPTVPILCNGQWSVDYTTGGQDHLATDICLFVVPSDYSPPLCSGCGTIPQEVYQNAIDWECIHRYILPAAALTVSADTICYGDSITLTASGGMHYLWRSLDLGSSTVWNTIDTIPSITVAPTREPYTKYQVEISDGMGGGAILEKIILSIKAEVVVLNKIVCVGDTATLTAITNGNFSPITSYLWSTGESTQSIRVFPLSSPASYTVTVTNALGCTKSATGTIYVQGSFLNTYDDSICVGQTTSLYAWGTSLLWNTGETSSSIYVSPNATSIYSVTVTTNQGCVYEFQDTIYVFPLPDANLVAIPNPICQGDSSLLIASGGLLYDWVGNEFDNIPLTSDSVIVAPTSSRNYQVKVFNEGCSVNKSVHIAVADSFSLLISTSKDTIMLGETAILIANGGGINSTYLWSTGETTSGIQVSPPSSTEFLVTVTNSDGCSRFGSIIVNVSTIVDTHKEEWVKSLTIHPNPTTGEFQVIMHLNTIGPVSISIVNENGQVMEERIEFPVSGPITSNLDLNYFPKGLYFVKININRGHQITRKIVKQ